MRLHHQRHFSPPKNHHRKVYPVTQLSQCEQLWKTFIKPGCVSDLWEFRLSFQKHFQHKPFFLVIEDSRGIGGMIPLSYVRKLDSYFLFPGEIWNNRTWLERTPVYRREDYSMYDVFKACPENSYLRYLEIGNGLTAPELSEDETGYVLYPGEMNFDIEKYYKRFSNKKLKAIKKVINSYSGPGCVTDYNKLDDFVRLVEMSLEQFGHRSFLFDRRFRDGFMDVMKFLHAKKILRMISYSINGELAAVDIGAVFNGIYTVFLGGTNFKFPGIAKLMNMSHIEYAFRKKFYKVDFLCGDFHWKLLWHLEPEILYSFKNSSSKRDNRTDIPYYSTPMIAAN